MKRVSSLLFVAMSLFLGIQNSFAQVQDCVFKMNKEEIPKIVVSQTAHLEAEPDKATVNIQVRTEETKLQKAYEKNAERMNQVVSILRGEGVDSKNIKTTQYSVTPMYNGKAMFSKVERPTSYVVTNEMYVSILKLESVGKILGKIADIDLVSVYGLEYTSTKMDDLKRQALAEAAADARATAEAMVAAAGGRLGKILKIEQNQPYVVQAQQDRRGPAMAMAFKAEIADLPEVETQPGTLKIEATATVTYAVEKKE